MCFNTQIKHSAKEITDHFKAVWEQPELFTPGDFNGFEFPLLPVLLPEDRRVIRLYHWGLIPAWAKNKDIRKFTLNAKIETIEEKASFKAIQDNRCLIIADAFYEWQWLDVKGTRKQKFRLFLPHQELFGFAGLWGRWLNPETQQTVLSLTLLTTKANPLLAEIHNSKKRMPIIITKEGEQKWLEEGKVNLDNDRIRAEKIEEPKDYGPLFAGL